MERPEYFVVRIYRRDSGDPDKIEGIVEVVASHKEFRFSNVTELGTILLRPSSARNRPSDRSEG